MNSCRPPWKRKAKTSLGQAVHWGIDLLEQRRRQYREYGVPSFRPWIFLITDGKPTDEWESAARRVRQGEAAGTFCFHAVGVEGADLGALQVLTGRPPYCLQQLASAISFAGSRSRSGRFPDPVPVTKTAFPLVLRVVLWADPLVEMPVQEGPAADE